MNPDANPNASNAPHSAPDPNSSANRPPSEPGASAGSVTSFGAAPLRPVTGPPGGGMRGALKLAVPLLGLVGVVFGITFLTQNAPKDPNTSEVDPKGPKVNGEPPLRFFTSSRFWDAPSLTNEYRELPMLAPSTPIDPTRKWSSAFPNRVFQGVYEQDPDTVRGAQFWFENRNSSSVTLQLRGVSCDKCSQGTLIAIPPEVTRTLLQNTALAALPIGPFNPFGVGLARPLAELKELPRAPQIFKDNPNATFHVPAATNADAWSPQWGILELGFTVRGNPGDPQKPLEAIFQSQVDGTTRVGFATFAVAFAVARPCEVWPTTIDVGRLDQLSTDKQYEFLVFSSTRGPGSEFGDLAPPKMAAFGARGAIDPIGFVEIAKVERIPETELSALAARLDTERKSAARVRTAYRVTATVHPKVGEDRMEIGAIDRAISVTAEGGVQQVVLKGFVRGEVSLDDDRTDIELASFRGGDGTTQEVNLSTERAETKLEIVRAECKPRNYTYTLIPQPPRGGRGYYKLSITVPRGEYGRPPGGAEVVLEVKGPTPQLIRIPVKSNGH